MKKMFAISQNDLTKDNPFPTMKIQPLQENHLSKTSQDLTDDLFQQAALYYNATCYHQAIAHLNRALILNPDEASYWTLRGKCYLMLNHLTFALSDLNRAVALGHIEAEELLKNIP